MEASVCVWCKCTIKENLQQSWLDCRSPPCTSYLENVDKLVFVANNMCFFEVYEKECGKLVKTATRLEKVLQTQHKSKLHHTIPKQHTPTSLTIIDPDKQNDINTDFHFVLHCDVLCSFHFVVDDNLGYCESKNPLSSIPTYLNFTATWIGLWLQFCPLYSTNSQTKWQPVCVCVHVHKKY